jgi:hypothetical protein
VLLTPIIGDSILDLRNSGIGLPPTYAMALAAQAYFGGIFFIAAARRYRSAAGIGIDTKLGLMLVLGWTAVTCVGLHEWEDYRPRGWQLIEVADYAKYIVSIIIGMLLALAPVAASAWAHAVWRRHELLKDPAPMRRPMASVFVIAIATALIMLIAYAQPISAPPEVVAVMESALVVAMALTAVYFVCAWIYFGYGKAAIVGLLWIALMWGAPVMVDLIRYGLADRGEVQPIDGIASASPVGALIAIWAKLPGVDVRPGMLLQFLLMCIPIVLRLMQLMRLRRMRQGL